MTRISILKGLLVISVFPLIFGIIMSKSFIINLCRADELVKAAIKIDSTYSSGGDYVSSFAIGRYNGKDYIFCITCEGAETSNYYVGSIVNVWIHTPSERVYLRNVSENLSDFKKRYWFYLLMYPAGVMVYPFFAFIIWFFYEKKRNTSDLD